MTKGGFTQPDSDRGVPAKWGVSHTVAAALTAIGLDVVHRATLRALLPEGRTTVKRRPNAVFNTQSIRRVNGLDAKSRRLIELGQIVGYEDGPGRSSKNHTSDAFQKALQRMESAGWIARGTRFILIRDRRGLADWATSADPPAGWALDFARSIQAIKGDLENPGDSTANELERRRQELLAIQRLMEQRFGGHNWSGRGSVRFLPRSQTI